MVDAELIKMLKGQKHESDQAFKIIYSRHSSRLHAYCLRILNNRASAEDIFQETFIRFYQNVRLDYKTGSVAGFLITIARNLCLNYKRDTVITVPLENLEMFLATDETDNKQEAYQMIRSAIELLDFDLKEALILRMYDGLSYAEISEIIGITNENARRRVFRAKQKIKGILEPYYKDLLY